MAGEFNVLDITGYNVGNANFTTVGTVVVGDVANSSVNVDAVKFPAAANDIPVGVLLDKSKLDPTGAVVPNSGIAMRIIGVVNCVAAGAISAYDRVAIANTSGQVQTSARTAAGAQPVAIVGIALSPTTAAGQAVSVLLTLGATW